MTTTAHDQPHADALALKTDAELIALYTLACRNDGRRLKVSIEREARRRDAAAGITPTNGLSGLEIDLFAIEQDPASDSERLRESLRQMEADSPFEHAGRWCAREDMAKP